MRRLAIAIATVGLLTAGLEVIAQPKCKADHLLQGYRFIEQLKRQAPIWGDVALRDYALEDIDHNGCFEVLERISDLEEKNVGLLNAELYPATVWINVYAYRQGKYAEALRNYSEFIRTRKLYYELWLTLLENPQVLSNDSREVLKTETKHAIVEHLRDYVNRLRTLQGR